MRLLTVARLQERKNHIRVVNAVIRLVKHGWIPDLEYDIVGSGKMKRVLQERIDLYGLKGRIRMYENVSDTQLRTFYDDCDVFILPSLTLLDDVEGFGIVYLEAGLHSKPVIAGNSGGSTDAVIHNHTGMLVDATSEEAIIEAIMFLYKNPRLRIEFGKNNRQFALEHSWDEQALKVEEVLQRCA